MDALSDSECSDSSESHMNSSASSSSSDSETSSQSLEPARILKQNLELPKGLCENKAIFDEFFSLDTWNSLPDHMRDQLKSCMPRFTSVTTSPQEEQQQQLLTIQRLFTNQITRFGTSPMADFQKNLEDGNHRPDISRLRANIRKSQRREMRFQQCERISRLAKSLAVSRERLLRAAYNSPPGVSLRVDKLVGEVPKLTSTAAALRAKKRYFQEISSVAEDVGLDGPLSEDENYPEGPPPQLSRKQRKYLYGMQVWSSLAVRCFDVMFTNFRFCFVQGLTPGTEPRIQSTTVQRNFPVEFPTGTGKDTSSLPDDVYRQLLAQHRKRKIDEPVSTTYENMNEFTANPDCNLMIFYVCRTILNWTRPTSKYAMSMLAFSRRPSGRVCLVDRPVHQLRRRKNWKRLNSNRKFTFHPNRILRWFHRHTKSPWMSRCTSRSRRPCHRSTVYPKSGCSITFTIRSVTASMS